MRIKSRGTRTLYLPYPPRSTTYQRHENRYQEKNDGSYHLFSLCFAFCFWNALSFVLLRDRLPVADELSVLCACLAFLPLLSLGSSAVDAADDVSTLLPSPSPSISSCRGPPPSLLSRSKPVATNHPSLKIVAVVVTADQVDAPAGRRVAGALR